MGRVLNGMTGEAGAGPTRQRPIRVLVVDDSVTMRRFIRQGLQGDARIEIVGEAGNAHEARDAVKRLMPDVMTLDIEMPGMNGLDFLERLMRARPMPVIMLSSLTASGSTAALSALALGALDCVEKPRFANASKAFAELSRKIVGAASARVRPPPRAALPAAPQIRPSRGWNGKWILIGASTGGVEALEALLSHFPSDGPPTLITQHMPAPFLLSFANRLDAMMSPKVRVARDGDRPAQGQVFLAPGGEHHLAIDRDGQHLRLLAGARRSGHRPSVDVMFESAIPHAPRTIAVILTGMGRDGAEQIRALHTAGATCIAQDRGTSVVYGMPRIAAELGGVHHVRPLAEIGPLALDLASLDTRAKAR